VTKRQLRADLFVARVRTRKNERRGSVAEKKSKRRRTIARDCSAEENERRACEKHERGKRQSDDSSTVTYVSNELTGEFL